MGWGWNEMNTKRQRERHYLQAIKISGVDDQSSTKYKCKRNTESKEPNTHKTGENDADTSSKALENRIYRKIYQLPCFLDPHPYTFTYLHI